MSVSPFQMEPTKKKPAATFDPKQLQAGAVWAFNSFIPSGK